MASRFRDMFMSAQEAVAAGLADEGVTVVFDATVPCADLENRIMHLRPLPEDLGSIDLEDCRGDADHETAHFKYTDINVLKKALQEAKGCPFLKLLINVIDDGRIERLMTAAYFGCGENLANSGARALEKMREQDDGSEDGRKRRAMAALTLLVFGHERKKAIRMVGEDVDGLLDDLNDVMGDMGTITTTEQVVRKSLEVKERWKEWAQDTSPPPPPPGGAGDSEGKPKPKPKPKKGDKEQPEGSGGSEKKKEVKVDGGGEDKSKKKKKKKKKVPTKSEIRKLAKKLKDCAIADIRKDTIREKKFKSSTLYTAYTVQDRTALIETGHVRWHNEEAFNRDVGKTVPVLRRKMMMEFRGVGRKVTRGQRKGRLDERSLFKVALGSDRVFQRPLPQAEVNAFVQLLVDCSGSMYGRRLNLAAQCAGAMSQTLDGIGVDHECTAFTSRISYDSTASTKAWKSKSYQRVCPLNHLIIKQATDTYRQSRQRFAALANYPKACENVDGEAVLWAAHRIMQAAKNGAKPVLIVFSDGMPASNPESFGVLNDHLKRSVERVEAAGIAVIGIGIQTTCVASFYKNYAVVSNLGDMAGEFFSVLRNVLKETSTIRR